MKIKKSHLKELIRTAISEFISEEGDGKYTHIGYGRYKEKGKEKDKNSPTFKKNDAGKIVPFDGDDVGGPAHPNVPKKEPSKPKITKIKSNPFADKKDKLPFKPDPPKDEPEMDAGGPAHANVPKGAKTSAQAKGMKKAQDLAKSGIPKDTMQQPFYKISYTDSLGRKKTDSMRASSPEEAKKDFENMNQGRGFKVTDVESEEKSEIPTDKTTRSSAEAYARTNNAAKDLGFSSAEDLVMYGASSEIEDLIDNDDVYKSIPDDLANPLNNALDFIRDNEMGMNADNDLADDYRGEILKMIQNPDGYGKEKETGDRLKQMDAPDDYEDSMDDLMKQMGDDGEISGMGAAEKANKKMEIDVLNKKAEKGQGELIDTEQFGMVTWVNGDPDEDSFIATNEDGEDIEIDYDEIIRFHNNNDSVMKNLNLESIQKSKQRRCTVKEVQKWMKGLEENRYKKVYNSDCRRVSWMVNNEGVDLQEMPKSMRKKWTKAQYGRERFLAREFKKHLNSKNLNEQRLRKTIRNIIKQIRG